MCPFCHAVYYPPRSSRATMPTPHASMAIGADQAEPREERGACGAAATVAQSACAVRGTSVNAAAAPKARRRSRRSITPPLKLRGPRHRSAAGGQVAHADVERAGLADDVFDGRHASAGDGLLGSWGEEMN